MFKKIVTLRYRCIIFLVLILTISFALPALYLINNIGLSDQGNSVKNIEESFDLENKKALKNTPSLVAKAWKKIGKIVPESQQRTVAALVGRKAVVRDIKGAQVIGYQNIYVTKESVSEVNDGRDVFSADQTKIMFNLPSRNRRFIGRSDALMKIGKQFNNQRFGMVVQTISGSGGVGKTQLATEFAYQAAKDYSVIFWVPSETINSVDYAYKEFARFLQIDGRGFGHNEIQLLVHHELVRRYKDSKILFILDNVSDYESIQEYIGELNKQLLTSFTLYVLITSRSQHWPKEPLILDTFAPQEALTFVKRHLPGEDEESLVKLTEALYYYPLALNQAVSYIKQHTNIDDYLTLYSTKRKGYLDKFSGDRNQYTESLWKTWHIALTKLSNVAKKMLFISSYLYPDDIPIAFFSNFIIEERMEAIKDLRKHSFIVLVNNNSFKIHRLLQEVIRLTLVSCREFDGIKNCNNNNTTTEEIKILRIATNLLRDKFNFDYAKPEQWGLWFKYLMHAQLLAEHMVSVKNKFICMTGMQLYAQVAMYLRYVASDIKEAQRVWKRMLDLVKHYYGDDKSSELVLANIKVHLGYTMFLTNSITQATRYITEAISVYNSKVTGISSGIEKLLTYLRLEQNLTLHDGIICDHVFALYCLGRLEMNLINFEKAKCFFDKALKMIESIFVPHCRVGMLGAIGRLYILQGKIGKARSVLRRAETIITQEDFPDNPVKGFIYGNFVKLMYYVGMYDEAKRYLEGFLRISDIHSGIRTANLAFGLTQLGLTLCSSGDVEKGLAVLKKAEIVHDRNYEKDHIWHIFLYIYMSYAYEMNRKYDKALQYLKRAQKIAIKYWGEKTHVALAHRLSPIEKLPLLEVSERNIVYYIEALDVVKDLFGENHIRTARYHYLLGQVFKNIRDRTKAKKHYRKALEIANKQHFDNEILVVGHQKNIKIIQEALGELLIQGALDRL